MTDGAFVMQITEGQPCPSILSAGWTFIFVAYQHIKPGRIVRISEYPLVAVANRNRGYSF